MNSNIPRHAIWKPGMTWDKVGELDPDTRHVATAGASKRRGAPTRHGRDGNRSEALLYPTWFAEGFHLVEDPDVAHALARAYNGLDRGFLQSRAGQAVRCVDGTGCRTSSFAVEELRRTAKIPCFRAAFIRPMFLEGHYFTHPIYDPLWAELENLGTTAAVHPAVGMWNPEWTSHGPFFEKIKTTAAPSFVHDRGRRWSRGWWWIGHRLRFHRVAATRTSESRRSLRRGSTITCSSRRR